MLGIPIDGIGQSDYKLDEIIGLQQEVERQERSDEVR